MLNNSFISHHFQGKIRTIRDEFSEDKRRKTQVIKDGSSVIDMTPREIRTFLINAVPI